MARPNYVCTICSEHFTRKFSAKRHNYSKHNGASEIVTFIEYMAGRTSGKYLHPSWYSRHTCFRTDHPNLESRTVADTRSSFRPQSFQQRSPLPYGSAYSTNPPAQQVQKLNELTVLLRRNASLQQAYIILEQAKSQLAEGDDRFLNDMLNHLRMLDMSQAWRADLGQS